MDSTILRGLMTCLDELPADVAVFVKARTSFAEISKLARFAGKPCPLERQ